jgi:hypothetical protein
MTHESDSPGDRGWFPSDSIALPPDLAEVQATLDIPVGEPIVYTGEMPLGEAADYEQRIKSAIEAQDAGARGLGSIQA